MNVGRDSSRDVFISHASEDKDAIARPLAQALRSRGRTVWFDEFELLPGDSLRRSIDDGLRDSRVGVVILSPRFFAKDWPKRELDGLTARQTAGEANVIVPIWHEVGVDDVRQFSPPLADLLASRSADGAAAIADTIGRLLDRLALGVPPDRALAAALPGSGGPGRAGEVLATKRPNTQNSATDGRATPPRIRSTQGAARRAGTSTLDAGRDSRARVEGAIGERWRTLGAESGLLGDPGRNQQPCGPDGAGRRQLFAGGWIYWTAGTGAWEVRGAIAERWLQLGAENSHLGYPLGDERACGSDGAGRRQQFAGGWIYWTTDAGACVLHGAIGARWGKLGAGGSHLGYALSDEQPCGADGAGRRQLFAGGWIYWTAGTGAWDVRGTIGEQWLELGAERSLLGYPRSGEQPSGVDRKGRRQQFAGGWIYWTTEKGASVFASS